MSTVWPSQEVLYCEACVYESTILLFLAPACIAHPGSILLHDYWAVYDLPSDIPSAISPTAIYVLPDSIPIQAARVPYTTAM